MLTEEWSETNKVDDNFEVVDLCGFVAKNPTGKSSISLECELNSTVERLQELHVNNFSCASIDNDSSLTCHSRSSNNTSRKVLKNITADENTADLFQRDRTLKFIDMKNKNLPAIINDSECTKDSENNSIAHCTLNNVKDCHQSSFEDEFDNGSEDDWLTEDMGMSSSLLSESNSSSFMLLNHEEELMVTDASSFVEQLQIERDKKFKVVSIIGNTGEGKSHTLNEAFCEGRRVFRTSSRQQAATIGCWAAYDPLHQALLLDTEGMLNNNQPIRLLLKVMAISDVVIYRTRSERLHSDMFRFLADASSLLHTHFPSTHPPPSIIISHHTQHTELLAKGGSKEAAGILLQKRFEEMKLTCAHFSGIHYVATKTHCNHNAANSFSGNYGNSHNNNNNNNCSSSSGGGNSSSSSYSELLLQVKQLLSNKQLSNQRRPQDVFKMLKSLNDRFSGALPSSPSSPHDFFTCRALCLSCQAPCDQTMNHHKRPHHTTATQCTPNKLLNNSVYLCKKCLSRGSRRVVRAPPTGIASYAWSGYSLECGHCGVVYRSRQHWFGNSQSEEDAVVMVTDHVWPGENSIKQGCSIDSNVGQRVVDGVGGVSEKLFTPCKYVRDWLAHQINPPYWEPNHLIKTCRACDVEFSDAVSIHHCRSCGRGFCDACSCKRRPVRERGWGDVSVRVCERCYHHYPQQASLTLPQASGEGDVLVRRVGEVLGSTIGAVSSIFSYPFAALKEAARPDYWVPDDQASNCSLCDRPFKHHSTPNIHHSTSTHHHYHRNSASTIPSQHIPSSSSDTNITKKIKDVSPNGGITTKIIKENENSSSNSNTSSSSNVDSKGLRSHKSLPLKLHHCRSCGQGVCGDCSEHQLEVPSRGWHHPVRVCDLCWQHANPSRN